MSLLLGVDGGGTRSAAVLAQNGRVIGAAEGAGLNFHTLGMAQARENLRALKEKICPDPISPDGICIGCAALDGEAEPDVAAAFLNGIFPLSRTLLVSDVQTALAVLPAGPAAVVIAGTGSMAIARDETGKTRTAGGWGPVLGDEGSGYGLTLAAMRRVIAAYEGIAPQTALREALLHFFDLRSEKELLNYIYRDPPPAAGEIAAFAPDFFSCAEKGDAAALEIADAQAAALAATAASLLRLLPAETPIGLWGGIFEHSALFRDAFSAALNRSCGAQRAALLPKAPVYGALKLAQNADQIKRTEN